MCTCLLPTVIRFVKLEAGQQASAGLASRDFIENSMPNHSIDHKLYCMYFVRDNTFTQILFAHKLKFNLTLSVYFTT